MATTKTYKLKVIEELFLLILSIGMSYYQEGCNIVDWLHQKCSTQVRTFERNPWLLNASNYGWPSFCFGQPGHALYLGGVFAQGHTGLTGRSNQSVIRSDATTSLFENRSDWSVSDSVMASFGKWGIYTYWPSSLRVAGWLCILCFPKLFFYLASSPNHSLWVVLTLGQNLWVELREWLCVSTREHSIFRALAVDVKITRETFVTLGGEASYTTRRRQLTPKLVVCNGKFVRVGILPSQGKRACLVETRSCWNRPSSRNRVEKDSS